jgi:hypothetical protein
MDLGWTSASQVIRPFVINFRMVEMETTSTTSFSHFQGDQGYGEWRRPAYLPIRSDPTMPSVSNLD